MVKAGLRSLLFLILLPGSAHGELEKTATISSAATVVPSDARDLIAKWEKARNEELGRKMNEALKKNELRMKQRQEEATRRQLEKKANQEKEDWYFLLIVALGLGAIGILVRIGRGLSRARKARSAVPLQSAILPQISMGKDPQDKPLANRPKEPSIKSLGSPPEEKSLKKLLVDGHCPYCLEHLVAARQICPICQHPLDGIWFADPILNLSSRQWIEILLAECAFINTWEWVVVRNLRGLAGSHSTEYIEEEARLDDQEKLMARLFRNKQELLHERGEAEETIIHAMKANENRDGGLIRELSKGRTWREKAREILSHSHDWKSISAFQHDYVQSLSWGVFGSTPAKNAVLSELKKRLELAVSEPPIRTGILIDQMPSFSMDSTGAAVSFKPTVMPRDPSPLRDRARGALMGLAVGDALGATLEFSTPVVRPFYPLLTGPHIHMLGEGPLGLDPGQVTDDTQMACILARHLLQYGGAIDAAVLMEEYLEWVLVTPDIGVQTRRILARYAKDRPVERSGPSRLVWQEGNRQPAGNGSLMRTAPIGVLLAQKDEERVRATIEDSMLTHFDPRCVLACVAFNGAIANCLADKAIPTAHKMTQAALSDLQVGKEYLLERIPDEKAAVEAAFPTIHSDITSGFNHPELYQDDLHIHRHQGFVRVALRLAFWELWRAKSFEEGLIDVVNRGGDADTNGAVVGALLGAYYGASQIPVRWLDRVMKAKSNVRECPRPDLYHPATLEYVLEHWEAQT